MIVIKESKTADTRSSDFKQVSKEQLKASSEQHIEDVKKGIEFFVTQLVSAMSKHDFDKLTGLDQFHADFITGFKQTGWWDNHRKINRHHLLQSDGVPSDVNLIDVLEMIVDCVMAGMGRTGNLYPLNIDANVLKLAFDNTTILLKNQIYVQKEKSEVKNG
jgi:hypothetical protein